MKIQCNICEECFEIQNTDRIPITWVMDDEFIGPIHHYICDGCIEKKKELVA